MNIWSSVASVFMETRETCESLFTISSGDRSGDRSGSKSAESVSSFLLVFDSLKILIKLTALAFDFFFGIA